MDQSKNRLSPNVLAALAVAAAVVAFILYRQFGVEPRFWAGACIAAHPPLACAPRQAVVWLQGQGLWGAGALVLGLAAFVTRRFVVCPFAVALGAVAVVNYNAGLGMLGAALGVWAWLRPRPERGGGHEIAAVAAGQAPGPQRSTTAPGD